MPNIPMPQSQVAARSARTQGPYLRENADPLAFGAGLGRGMQAVGEGLSNLGGEIYAYGEREKERKRREELANRVAQLDFTPVEVQTRGEVPANGDGYRDLILERYDAFVEENANQIDDDVTRSAYRAQMMANRANYSQRAALYEEKLAEDSSRAEADASLSGLENRIMTDPTSYAMLVEQGEQVISSRPGLTATQRQAMTTVWRQNSARDRFVGMMENADTVEDIDRIAAELATEQWQTEFKADDYERTVNALGTARQHIMTAADASARAAIDTLEARNSDGVLVPREELEAAAGVVRGSQNPVTQARFARVLRDQDLYRAYRGATPAEIRADINASAGNPGAAYPGVPPVVSAAINGAASDFNVSASYLGGTAIREYGGFLSAGEARVDEAFQPTLMSADLNAANIRSDVYRAVTVAGELFGAPLALPAQSATPEGLDVSIVGMSEVDQGRLVGALVDAGFTGVRQYEDRVHVDMRDAVSAEFGEREGKRWGGWTYLSPSVAAALDERGFAAGAEGAAIRRSGPAAAGINYGIKAETSSATGLMQFTDATWLGVASNPAMAARVGLSPTLVARLTTGTDEEKAAARQEVLALRANPTLSVRAAAAIAEQNKRILEGSLGRPVSDAELYMAHFLGAGGSTSLLTRLRTDPNSIAADLLPDAAAANHGIFYSGDEALTVQQVYNELARTFVNAPSHVTYGDNETRERMLAGAEDALRDDPMTYVRDNGVFDVSPLTTPSSFAARGVAARSAADYYNIPMSDFKPLTIDEVAAIKTRMDGASADDVMSILSSIQGMGGDVARAAFAQIGQEDKVYGYAAGLAYEAGAPATATDVIRGRKRVEENPAIREGVGTPADITNAFNRAVNGTLFGIAPDQRQAIQDAAFAHYIETFIARGGSGLDSGAFDRSVQAVLGGAPDRPALANVNGAPTILPPGITADVMNKAIDTMTPEDWARMSPQGLPPRYASGEIASPGDLAYQARLEAVGGGAYRIKMDDGTVLTTGNVLPSGNLEAYIFAPDAEKLREMAARPDRGPYPAPPGPPGGAWAPRSYPPVLPGLYGGGPPAPPRPGVERGVSPAEVVGAVVGAFFGAGAKAAEGAPGELPSNAPVFGEQATAAQVYQGIDFQSREQAAAAAAGRAASGAPSAASVYEGMGLPTELQSAVESEARSMREGATAAAALAAGNRNTDVQSVYQGMGLSVDEAEFYSSLGVPPERVPSETPPAPVREEVQRIVDPHRDAQGHTNNPFPVAIRVATSTILGDKRPITQFDLRQDEIAVLQRAVQAAEARGTNRLTYGDYDNDGDVAVGDYEAADFVGGRVIAGGNDLPVRVFSDTGMSVSFILGNASFRDNGDGTVTIRDSYDFKGTEEQMAAIIEEKGNRMNALMWAYEQDKLMGVYRFLLNMVVPEGKGRPVEITFPKLTTPESTL